MLERHDVQNRDGMTTEPRAGASTCARRDGYLAQLLLAALCGARVVELAEAAGDLHEVAAVMGLQLADQLLRPTQPVRAIVRATDLFALDGGQCAATDAALQRHDVAGSFARGTFR